MMGLIGIAALALGLQIALGQETTSTTEGPTSNVSIFYVACETQGVIELSGEMQPGFDVYFQLYSAAGGGGAAVSTLRRVQVNGTYTFSEVVPYSDGITLAAGAVGSVYVAIARESDASSTVFETTVNDLQDGCAEPTIPPGTSTDLGVEVTEEPVAVQGSGVLSPFGGEVNPGQPAEPLVKIGARREPGRSATAGLIFAECDAYPLTDPGLLYDTDDLIVFWSWFARTPQQVQQHIDNAIYAVTLNGQPFPNVERTAITQRGRNYWVFYIARMGRFWRPGGYGIEYRLSWANPISDGFDDFGPGTENESIYSTCTFTVRPNPYGVAVSHAAPPIPTQAP